MSSSKRVRICELTTDMDSVASYDDCEFILHSYTYLGTIIDYLSMPQCYYSLAPLSKHHYSFFTDNNNKTLFSRLVESDLGYWFQLSSKLRKKYFDKDANAQSIIRDLYCDIGTALKCYFPNETKYTLTPFDYEYIRVLVRLGNVKTLQRYWRQFEPDSECVGSKTLFCDGLIRSYAQLNGELVDIECIFDRCMQWLNRNFDDTLKHSIFDFANLFLQSSSSPPFDLFRIYLKYTNIRMRDSSLFAMVFRTIKNALSYRWIRLETTEHRLQCIDEFCSNMDEWKSILAQDLVHPRFFRNTFQPRSDDTHRQMQHLLNQIVS